MVYRKEIDGLRAIALVPVILFHADFEWFSGGYVGVDVFFVISGYLIASIILQEHEKGAFRISKFYERRARRILPALFFITLCCVPFAWLWMLPDQQKDFAQSMSAIVFFISNIFFWDESGYFEAASEEKPLLHTWSLAVEEQFYLFFPLLVILLWRSRHNFFIHSIAILAIASLMLSEYSSRNFPSANFYLSHTRVWELFLGVICALPQMDKWKRRHDLLSLAGLSMILYSVFVFSDETRFPSLYALIPVIGTCLVILFGSSGSIAARLLSTRLLVGIGLISYSGYLWHQPLFAFARIRSPTEPPPELFLLLSAVSLMLAYFSWKYVECPFRNRQATSTRFIVRSLSVTAVIVFSIGAFGNINKGFGDRTLSNGVTLSELDYRLRSNHGLVKDCEIFPVKTDCKTSDKPELLVWGDSYAAHLVKGILASRPDVKMVQLTKSACEPSFHFMYFNDSWRVKRDAEECLEFNKQVLQWLGRNKTVKYAVVASSFWHFVISGGEIMTEDGILKSSAENSLPYFVQTLEALKQRGIKPVIFAPPPQTHRNDRGLCIVRMMMLDGDLSICDFDIERSNTYLARIKKYLGELEDEYQIIQVSDEICAQETCRVLIDGAIIYNDDRGHLSHEGSAFIGERMNFYELITRPN